MKLTSLRDVRALLAVRGIRPSKALGQNFLFDANLIEWIMNRAEVGPADEVLEIGAGLGGLTEALARRAGRVVAVETDARLMEILSERTAKLPNVERILGDALEMDVSALFGGSSWKVVSNLPYSVGTRILIQLVETKNCPERIVATLQRDVAERIIAEPGTAAYGLLAIWTQRRYAPCIAHEIRPSSFYPAPKVVSAVVDLRRRPAPRCAPRDLEHFRQLTRAAFLQRRKQIQRILRDLPPALAAVSAGTTEALLASLAIPPDARPENLSVEQWGALSDALSPSRGGAPCG